MLLRVQPMYFSTAEYLETRSFLDFFPMYLIKNLRNELVGSSLPEKSHVLHPASMPLSNSNVS